MLADIRTICETPFSAPKRREILSRRQGIAFSLLSQRNAMFDSRRRHGWIHCLEIRLRRGASPSIQIDVSSPLFADASLGFLWKKSKEGQQCAAHPEQDAIQQLGSLLGRKLAHFPSGLRDITLSAQALHTNTHILQDRYEGFHSSKESKLDLIRCSEDQLDIPLPRA